jgi:hypothetical protein
LTEPLRILLVDDEVEPGGSEQDGGGSSAALARILRGEGHDAEALGPSEVKRSHIQSRDLILVDFRITEEWTPAAAPLVQQPQEGLAVLAVLRSWLEDETEATGLALHSAKLEDLAKGMALGRAEHVIARLHGLEWAFSKLPLERTTAPSHQRVVSLAKAVRMLVGLSGEGDDWKAMLLDDVLSLPPEPWADAAKRQLEVAQLPQDELIRASGGLVALRWLAHRLLPYPGVLVGPSYTAAILGVDPSLLVTHDSQESALSSVLDAYRYRGALSNFGGPRWWRAGLEHQLAAWAPSDIALASDESVAEVAKLTGEGVEPQLGMVACVGDDFEPSGQLAPKLECVRLRPDDWPVFAAPAWMKIDDVLEDGLRHYVDPADLELLEQ